MAGEFEGYELLLPLECPKWLKNPRLTPQQCVLLDQKHLSCRHRGFEGWPSGWTPTAWKGMPMSPPPHAPRLVTEPTGTGLCQVPVSPSSSSLLRSEKFLFRTGSCGYTVVLVQYRNWGAATFSAGPPGLMGEGSAASFGG